ncbi:MAG: CopG family transcriptional regulator [Verrucomicrobiales bacterium]|mgnify:CR=1 FL=1|nr:CopG family transcriptional regulator [Verrucomicrobiales bacterium]MDP6679411.1 CopG family transcriptional regulator [Verrucomicrobiota bacterium]MDP6753023.1 CopG family transcriptional regulator [Verrucomicrobiota bacterium]
MSTLAKRATVYLDPAIHRALQLQSIQTSRSVSKLINDAVRAELAEDVEDLAAFEERANEPTLDFETFVKELKRDGTI